MLLSPSNSGTTPGEKPLKYKLSSKSTAGVTPMPISQQTLKDAAFKVKGGKSILEFTKVMKEPNEIELTTSFNNFIWAVGSNFNLGPHKDRGSNSILISKGSFDANWVGDNTLPPPDRNTLRNIESTFNLVLPTDLSYTEVTFNNDEIYTQYRVTFPTTRVYPASPNTPYTLDVGELELVGELLDDTDSPTYVSS